MRTTTRVAGIVAVTVLLPGIGTGNAAGAGATHAHGVASAGQVANATSAGNVASATGAIGVTAADRVNTQSWGDRLVRAWGRGDRSAALYFAAPAVVNTLFGYSSPGGGYWRLVGSQGAAGTAYLTYHDDLRGGTLTIGVSGVRLSQGQHQAVDQARFGQQPAGAVGYADLLIRAWGRGDRRDAARYATPGVVGALFAHFPAGGGRHWARTTTQGAIGKVYVCYLDTQTRSELTLTLDNERAATGREHAAYQVRFGS